MKRRVGRFGGLASLVLARHQFPRVQPCFRKASFPPPSRPPAQDVLSTAVAANRRHPSQLLRNRSHPISHHCCEGNCSSLVSQICSKRQAKADIYTLSQRRSDTKSDREMFASLCRSHFCRMCPRRVYSAVGYTVRIHFILSAFPGLASSFGMYTTAWKMSFNALFYNF